MQDATGSAATATYYRRARPGMLRFVPTTARRVLELGCAEGAFAAAVKRRSGAEVWGIEFNPEAARQASVHLDRVLIGDADTHIAALPDGYFDVLICNDVLEHLVNPADTLLALRRKLTPEGILVSSIPNIRFLPALSKIVFRRDFPQEDSGIFDRTHLRFFTRKSMVRMFETAGFTVRELRGINPQYRPLSLALTVLTLGYFADCLYLQFACIVSPSEER